MVPTEQNAFAEFWDALQAMDADELARRFAASGTISFGASRGVQGRDAVRREFVRLFARTASIHGSVVSLWARGGLAVADCDMAFHFDDGTGVNIPVTLVCWFSPFGIARSQFSFYPEPALGRMAA
jgi:hypothetical protein